jgi:hypothetical protein
VSAFEVPGGPGARCTREDWTKPKALVVLSTLVEVRRQTTHYGRHHDWTISDHSGVARQIRQSAVTTERRNIQ